VKKALESFKVFDKTLLFMGRTIEKFPLCVKEKGTTTNVDYAGLEFCGSPGIWVGVK